MLGSRPDFVARFVAQIHGTYWYSLVPIGTRRSSAVPTSTNSHKHNQDSNSLGGTKFPQARGLSSPISRVKSGYKCLWAESGSGAKPQLRGCGGGLNAAKSIPFCPESAFG